MVHDPSNRPSDDPNPARGNLARLARLADLIRAHAPYDGHFNLRLPGLEVVRASRPNQERIHGIVRPALCLVAQGAKTVFLGDATLPYGRFFGSAPMKDIARLREAGLAGALAEA
jgi:hypothetical protein